MIRISVGRALGTYPRRGLPTRAPRQWLSSLLSVEDEYPGLPSVSPEPSKASTVSVSTLRNGLTVVSEDACTTSTVTLTYPKAGSASEALGEQGAAYGNKFMNFKSGSGLSTLLINRTIEDEGGAPFTSVNRSAATVGYTVAPEKAIGLIPLLATDCSFEKWDVRDAKAVAAVEVEEASSSAQVVLTETLFAAAYGPQSTAGRPLYSLGASVDSLKEFRARAYGMKGAVLSATGVKDHAALCTEVESLLSDAPQGSEDSPASLSYLGGESRVAAPSSGFAHVALAFPRPAGAVAAVVQQVLNIMGSDKGVSSFCTEGLVGVYAGSSSPGSITDDLIKTCTTSLTPEVIKRAKGLAKAEALFSLDGGSQSLAAAMTAAVVETGCCFSGAADVVAQYDSVTDAQVKESFGAIRSSNPSLAAIGDITAVAYHATVAAQLK